MDKNRFVVNVAIINATEEVVGKAELAYTTIPLDLDGIRNIKIREDEVSENINILVESIHGLDLSRGYVEIDGEIYRTYPDKDSVRDFVHDDVGTFIESKKFGHVELVDGKYEIIPNKFFLKPN